MLTVKNEAKLIAELTADAYSAKAYRSWAAVAEKLLRRGYRTTEVIEIMNSKYTRWARDYAGDVRKDARWGRYSANDVVRYFRHVSKNSMKRERAMIAELMAE
jgi:tagatose-1,6-bisphosphate aldolase non-catalytic subunit AgaZ/GatZ